MGADPTEPPHTTDLSTHLRSVVVSPKDKTQKGLMYSMKYCGCDKDHIGERARTVGVRFKEHTDGNIPSWLSQNTCITDHTYTLADESVCERRQ